MNRSALFWAVFNRRDAETIEDYLQTGKFDLNEADHFGTTILMMAVLKESTATVRLLLKYGADPNLCDCFGNTPLTLAATDKNHAAVRALLDGGAHPDICDRQGNSPLIHAAYAGCLKSTQHLLNAGARTELRDHQDWTAADYALDHNYADIAIAIIDAELAREQAAQDKKAAETKRESTLKSGVPVKDKVEGLSQIKTRNRRPKP